MDVYPDTPYFFFLQISREERVEVIWKHLIHCHHCACITLDIILMSDLINYHGEADQLAQVTY